MSLKEKKKILTKDVVYTSRLEQKKKEVVLHTTHKSDT